MSAVYVLAIRNGTSDLNLPAAFHTHDQAQLIANLISATARDGIGVVIRAVEIFDGETRVGRGPLASEFVDD